MKIRKETDMLLLLFVLAMVYSRDQPTVVQGDAEGMVFRWDAGDKCVYGASRPDPATRG